MIDIQDIIVTFGTVSSEDSKNYTFQCPLCKDEGKDNLKIKKSDGLITCFANKDHSIELRKNHNQFRINDTENKSEVTPIVFNEAEEKERKKYLKACQKNVTESSTSLIIDRGLKYNIIKELGLGIDLQKNAWVFPMYHHSSNHLIGFEFRDIQMLPRKKGGNIWKSKGYFSCLCQLSKIPKAEQNNFNLYDIIICEGFIDAYLMYQYYKEQLLIHGDILPVQILTPSNGVNAIVNHIKSIKFNKKRLSPKIYLCLDNDEAGEKAMGDIIQKLEPPYLPLINKENMLPKKYKDFCCYYNKRY
jgi:hypothetical protein